jgi:glutathione S-transferase
MFFFGVRRAAIDLEQDLVLSHFKKLLYEIDSQLAAATQQLARQLAGEFIAGDDLGAVDECCFVALGVLHKAATVSGEVVRH